VLRFVSVTKGVLAAIFLIAAGAGMLEATSGAAANGALVSI
jgi:hypothetical protein